MKQLLYLLLAFMTLASCQKGRNISAQLRQAEMAAHINADSALLILTEINTDGLSAADTQRYEILLSEVRQQSAAMAITDTASPTARARRAQSTALWIRQFDEANTSSRARERWLWIAAIAAAFAIASAAATAYHRRKMKKFSSIIDEEAHHIMEYRREIEMLRKNESHQEQQIDELKAKINEWQDHLAAKLHIGMDLYERMRQGEPLTSITAADTQCLVDYFALMNPRQWYLWEQKYNHLTRKQILFLILQDDLNFDDSRIEHALGIKNTAVRSIRSRIRSRQRAKQ